MDESGIAIKYYHFHNAYGECAPGWASEAFDFVEIVGLGNGSEVGSKGWLCFCKSRQWFAEFIVTPFVKTSRDINDNKNPDGSSMRAFVTCDGEEAQIRVFQEQRMLSLFADTLIDFG